MKILVLGAGAVGGYFGARLMDAGQDVRFLVRPQRAAILREHGLRVRSPFGDLHLPTVKLLETGAVKEHADLVILSCKAYDLDASIEAIVPAVGPHTAVLPLLNGMAHLERLSGRFGQACLVPGLCTIASTLGEHGVVMHLNRAHGITFGDAGGGISARAQQIADVFAKANFESSLSDDVMPLMWGKWVQLAALAGSTTLMRAAIGDIMAAPGGEDLVRGMIAEGLSVAHAAQMVPPAWFVARAYQWLTDPKSTTTASMYRDITRDAQVEAEHVIGDLVRRGRAASLPVPRLEMAYLHLKAYEARRARLMAADA